jgi:hypothetical protein
MRNFPLSRRHLLTSAALTLPVGGLAHAEQLLGPLTPQQRQHFLARRRRQAARTVLKGTSVTVEINGDEDRYPDRRASFSKTMPHDELGEVNPDAYREWLSILASGDSAQFEQAPRDFEAVERLNNPQAAYSIDLVGIDPAELALPAPPSFASQAMAAEVIELYWLALMRDVSFRAYESDPLARVAVSDLVTAGFGPATEASLFRGETEGDRRGPFVSQFLWHDIPYGMATIEQRFRFPARGQHFLTTFPEWLDCQRGAKARASLRFDATPRYISSYRELVEYVHRDFSFQAFLDAALIILGMGGDRGDAVLSRTNPYRDSSVQFGDITFGNKNLLSLLAQVSLLAQKASYYQKWQVHRRARPEVLGARIDVHLSGRKSYDLHQAILQCEALARVKKTNGSWLLPQAYPEGCPTHPSYPAAHAVNAGACVTVLKAFFDGDFVIPRPVQATADGARLEPWHGGPLALGAELDKLAANIALARDAAGVHFRSDSVRGLHLGEEVALGLLAAISLTYSEQFGGFVLSRFDGARLLISNGSVHTI